MKYVIGTAGIVMLGLITLALLAAVLPWVVVIGAVLWSLLEAMVGA